MKAYKTKLEFSGEMGEAIVVEFAKDWRFVFWDKAQYVGCIDLGEGVWFTPEWCEVNSPNDLHCYEPIMDKQLRWSKVEIIESGSARVRVKWSYVLNNMRYQIFHGNTHAEEIYTIYPDGIAVREVILWPGNEDNLGGNANFWQTTEWILINAAGTNPLDILNLSNPFTLMNGTGESINLTWPLPADDFEPLCDHFPQIADWSLYIGQINLRENPNPFTILFKDQSLFPYISCNACEGEHPYFGLFPGKNLYNVYKHWPVTEMEDFIEWVPAGDDIGKVATHTSFVSTDFARRRNRSDLIPSPDQGATWYFLIGATKDNNGNYLRKLAKSYHNPATIKINETAEINRGSFLYEGFDYAVRAYTFRKTKESKVDFQLIPTETQINPVFIIKDSFSKDITVFVNEKMLKYNQYEVQFTENDLIIWIKGQYDQETNFKIC